MPSCWNRHKGRGLCQMHLRRVKRYGTTDSPREFHGAARDGRRTPEYKAWGSMKDRCENPRCPAWKWYGARGIRIDEGWRKSFGAFIADVGPRPSSKHSLDRINNDGHYEPGNVRWATWTEQLRNRRDVVRLTLDGVTRDLYAWAALTGLNPGTLASRVRYGWDAVRALTQPPDRGSGWPRRSIS